MGEYFLQGQKIGLRPLALGDVDGPYPEWFNDPEVTKFTSHGRCRNTVEKTREYVLKVCAAQDALVMAICDLRTSQHVGNVSLQLIDYTNKTAELAIIIGERSFHSKGVGFESCSLMVRHGFERLGLNRIYAMTLTANEGMMRLAKKLGMKHEGILRQNFIKNGKIYDTAVFGLIRDEY